MGASTETPAVGEVRSPEIRFAIGVARAGGGALFFSLPLLMTMEMWSLGAAMDRWRLVALIVLFYPLLATLAYYSGFEEDKSWREAALDGLVAYGVGYLTASAVLSLFGIIEWTMPPREIVGMVSLEAIPAALGAVLASSQFGGGKGGETEDGAGDADGAEEAAGAEESAGAGGAAGAGEAAGAASGKSDGYGVELLFMLTGALFLAFNVAPTEEMLLIAFRIGRLQALGIVAVSLALMHAFVYAVEFHGTAHSPEDVSEWSLFLRFTVVGYAIALVVSAYVLWSFGRFEDHAPAMVIMQSVVLGLPAALGAAGARLIL